MSTKIFLSEKSMINFFLIVFLLFQVVIIYVLMQIQEKLAIVQKNMNSFEEAGIIMLHKLIQLNDKVEKNNNKFNTESNAIKNTE